MQIDTLRDMQISDFILFYLKNEKIIISMSSAELALSVNQKACLSVLFTA